MLASAVTACGIVGGGAVVESEVASGAAQDDVARGDEVALEGIGHIGDGGIGGDAVNGDGDVVDDEAVGFKMLVPLVPELAVSSAMVVSSGSCEPPSSPMPTEATRA